jgi:YegS/Rv2252/BmrU family lipid kinase
MEMRPIVFVVNPRSAAGATRRRFEAVRAQFRARLQAVGASLDVRLTTHPRHATLLAREAVQQGALAVVAVGGDGTNNEVINGFFDESGARLPGDTAFGVVTSGTGGDFRRSFGWSTNPYQDLERLCRLQRRRIDVGRLTCRTPGGTDEVSRFFVNISSFGLSGLVVDTVNRSSKALGAKLSFMAGSVRSMVGHRPQRVRFKIDDGPPEEADISLVALANGQYFGGGMWVAPDALPDDGLLDAVVIRGGGLPFWIKNGLKIYTGGHRALPGVTTTRCTRFSAEPAQKGEVVLIDLDGEQPGELPARWEILPAAVDLLV